MNLKRGQISGNCLGKEGKGEVYWKSWSASFPSIVVGSIDNPIRLEKETPVVLETWTRSTGGKKSCTMMDHDSFPRIGQAG